METTGKALVDHWQWVGTKGLMNTTSTRIIRTACQQVLSVQEGWETLDVTQLDTEQTFRCFENLNGRNLTPNSLRDYRRRFEQGCEMFLDYVRDPSNWKPNMEKPRKLEIAADKRTKSDLPRLKPQSRSSRKERDNGEGLMDYPFPIRSGIIARLQLPEDLTTTEAKRLANFISSLAVDSEFEAPEIEERHVS